MPFMSCIMEERKVGLIFLLGFIMFLEELLLCMAQGQTHHYEFVLEEKNFTRLCESKSMLTVNGTFPGPTIQVNIGDTFYVNVRNQGTYGVTIHWHGVKQPRNPWSDGPENITQCPIQPGTNFTYEVILSTEEGTLWWHAHSDWTRATVHGAIVILPSPGKTYPFLTPDGHQTIVIGTWFKGDVKKIIDEALRTGGEPNQSNAYTINGQPGDLYPCSNDSTFHMNVEHGKTYLLRIINAVMNQEQFFGIANHNLSVVGQDGAYIKPVNTSYIMITPGQTMDVLVTANQTPSYYYMASSPFSDGDTVAFDNTTTTAIFEYNGNYTAPPYYNIPLPPLPRYDDETAAANFTRQIRSLYSTYVPKNITKNFYITVSVNTIPCPYSNCSGPNGDRLAASMNNVSFVTNSTSILQAYYSNMKGVYDTDFPREPPYYFNFTGDGIGISAYTARGTKVIMLDYGDEVEVVFQGTSLMAAENHPMHLHGFSFYFVGSDIGNFNSSTDPSKYNLKDPPEINTVGLPRRGWAAIRFTADNPGVWFSHCHLERHSSWGMDTVFIVKNGPSEDTSMLPPPLYMPPCSIS